MSPTTPHNAASTGRRFTAWRGFGGGPNAVVAASAPELVRRSRDLKRNNPHAKRALGLYSTHIVGTGIKPSSLCSDAVTRTRIHALWERWTDYADADGGFDFYGLQMQAVDELATAGESFARLRPRRIDDGLPVPLQLQLLPAEQLPLSYSTTTATGNAVVQGIERDIIGRRVAYWFYRQHPGDAVLSAVGDALSQTRVDAADVCHLRLTEPGQLRGLPWLSAAMTTLKQLGDWQDASLLRKQLVTSLVGFVRKAISEDMDAQKLAESWGKVTEELGALPAVALEPGTMQYLDLGEEVEFTNWQETAGADETFIRTSMRSVAMAADLVYEELTGDWSQTNDRTFRAAFATFKRAMRQFQHHLLCFQFNRPVYLRFLDLAIASGALIIPKGMPAEDYQRVAWIPERWEYLNPKQDIEAVKAEIDAGLTSRTAAVAERGDDIEQVDAQRQADREREQKLGLSVVPVPGTIPGMAKKLPARLITPGAPVSAAAVGVQDGIMPRLTADGLSDVASTNATLANKYRDPQSGRFTFGPGGKKIKGFVSRSRDKSKNEVLVLSGVTNAARVTRDSKLDPHRYSFDRYRYTLGSSEVRKIDGKHGPNSPMAKNGAPPTDTADYKRLSAILTNPEKVKPGDNNHLVGTGVLKGADDTPALVFEKPIGGYRYTAIVRVQRKNWRLAVLSLWKVRL